MRLSLCRRPKEDAPTRSSRPEQIRRKITYEEARRRVAMKVITCSVVVEILFISSLDGLVRTELTDQINYYNNGSGDFFFVL